MKHIVSAFCCLLSLSLSAQQAPPTSTTNQGTEFWVAYGHHQFFEAESINTQNMTIYLSVSDLPAGASYATVTLEIDSSAANHADWFRRIYHIPANTVISIDDSASVAYLQSYSPVCAKAYGPIPKGSPNSVGCGDYRILDPKPPTGTGGERVFRNRAIHITSDYPIVAYAHIYGSANSGATMLIPYSSWGLHYTSVNSRQANASAAYSFFYVIAANDNTPVKIVPSQPSRLGKPAGVPIYLTLEKGQIYQYVGQVDAGGNGVQLTGSTVEALDSTKPVAVFSGSSRTEGESTTPCAPSTRDNDMQQCFPQEIWGTAFLTAPFSTANGSSNVWLSPSLFTTTVYKVIARDPGTIVTIQDNTQTSTISLAVDTFYSFFSKWPCKISANKPIMVSQFMSSNNCVANSSNELGDPEMCYLSPTERGIKQTGFYRHTKQDIKANFVTLIVPNDGLSTLTIDTVPYLSLTNAAIATMPHPQDSTHTIVVVGWRSLRKQCLVQSDKRFTGITYGMGIDESYGYNIGSNFYLHTPNVYPADHPEIKGVVFADVNSNGVQDSNEFPMTNVKIELSNGSFTFSNINGYYELDADSIGTYTTLVTPPPGFSAVPQTTTYVFGTYDTVVTTNIALQPVALRDSLVINVVPAYSRPLSSHSYPYFVEYENRGSKNITASTQLSYNGTLLVYDSCSDHSASHAGSVVSTQLAGLKPGQRKTLIEYFTIKPSANTGDEFKTKFSIGNSSVTVADSFVAKVASSDLPQSTEATPVITPTQIAAGGFVEYTLHFRNTNTYMINNVRITDTLSGLLQANSLQMVNATHPCKVTVKGNTILFELLNINLKDVNANKFKSFGYIKFRVRPRASVAVGDVIRNKAILYFDYDDAITTNVATTVVNTTGSLPVKITRYACILREKNTVLNSWEVATEHNVAQYVVLRSADGRNFEPIGTVAATGSKTYSFADEHLPVGLNTIYYRIEILDKDGSKVISETRSVHVKAEIVNTVVYPNPSSGNITVETFDTRGVIILDRMGRKVYQKQLSEASHSVTTVYGLVPGVYFVQAISLSGDVSTQKVIVQ